MKLGSIIAVTAVSVASFAGVASASTTHLTPTQVTCNAFTAWSHHHSTANLDRLVIGSFRVPWRYLGDDVWGLYADVRSGSVSYIHGDERYIQEDCS